MAIVVTNPTSVSEWERGIEYTITWTGGGDNVNIDLYKNSVWIERIANALANNHQYAWTPGLGLKNGLDYQIYIETYYNGDGVYSDEFLIHGDVTVELNENLGLSDSTTKGEAKVLTENNIKIECGGKNTLINIIQTDYEEEEGVLDISDLSEGIYEVVVSLYASLGTTYMKDVIIKAINW